MNDLQLMRLHIVEDLTMSLIDAVSQPLYPPLGVQAALRSTELAAQTWRKWIIDGDENVAWNGPLDYYATVSHWEMIPEALATAAQRTVRRLEGSYDLWRRSNGLTDDSVAELALTVPGPLRPDDDDEWVEPLRNAQAEADADYERTHRDDEAEAAWHASRAERGS